MKFTLKITLLISILISQMPLKLPAQYITKHCVVDYAKSYLSDSKKYVSAPLQWRGKDFVLFSGAVAVGGLLFWQDEWIQKQIPNPNTFQLAVIENGFNNLGNGVFPLPLMGGMFLYGTLAKKEKPFNSALSGVKAFVLSTIVTRAIKYSFNRHRPLENDGAYFFAGPFNPFSLSFPSGHTTTAFAFAAVMAKNYKHKPIIPILSYTLATSVAVARVWSKEHWASDVFVGALVGWSVGTIVSHIDCSEKSSFHITPTGLYYSF